MDNQNLSGYNFASVTPSDTNYLPDGRSTGIFIAATANLTVDNLQGLPVTFTGLAGGVIHPIRTRKVYATGTTATGIVALQLQNGN